MSSCYWKKNHKLDRDCMLSKLLKRFLEQFKGQLKPEVNKCYSYLKGFYNQTIDIKLINAILNT